MIQCFNNLLDDVEERLGDVCENTGGRWLKERFLRYRKFCEQSDYCDKCAELKMRQDGAKRSLEHLYDNGSTESTVIRTKMEVIESVEANL